MGNGIASTWSVFTSVHAHRGSPIVSHYAYGTREKELGQSYGSIWATAAFHKIPTGWLITFISASGQEHTY